jgi:hypothetical protein
MQKQEQKSKQRQIRKKASEKRENEHRRAMMSLDRNDSNECRADAAIESLPPWMARMFADRVERHQQAEREEEEEQRGKRSGRTNGGAASLQGTNL